MIWDKLVDRCLLFTDAPGGLLKELLKEAEIEISNKLELYDALYTIIVPNTISGLGIVSNEASSSEYDSNYAVLPQGYIRDVSVMHQGAKLRKISEEEIYRSSNNNKVDGGTPTAYAISGDFIIFNRAPSATDRFLLHYKASLTERTNDKVLGVLGYSTGLTSKVDLATELTSELVNKKILWESTERTLTAYNADATLMTNTSVPGVPDKGYINNTVESSSHLQYKSNYTLNSALAGSVSTNGTKAPNGSMCVLKDYRSIAPVIPSRFHTSLCDYAVALANAKSSPELYNNYWTKWTLNMENYMNQSLDRDLIHNIKEEI
jgi:hypothetical protein